MTDKCKNKKNNIFLRFLLSYMLILLIPVLVLGFAYNKFIKTMEYSSMKSNLALLEQSRDIIDRRLSEIDHIIPQIAWNPKVRDLLYMNDSPDRNVVTINDVSKELSHFTVSNSFIKNFYIYFKKTNIILSPYTSYITPELMYGQLFKFQDMTFDEFYNTILDKYHYKEYTPAIPITMNKSQKNMIVCMQSIPYELPNDFQGNMIFFVEESEIQKLLKGLELDLGGWAYIADKNGKIITSYSENDSKISQITLKDGKTGGFVEHTISGEKMVISHTFSEYNGWTYVAALPQKVVMSQVVTVRRIIFYIAIITLIISLVAAYLLAYNNSKPLQEIMGLLRTTSDINNERVKNEFVFLKGSISRLIDNNTELKQEMDNQIPMLKAVFLDRIFKGDFRDTSEMNAVLAHTGLSITGVAYGVLLLRVHGYTGLATNEILRELYLKRVIVNEILTSVLGQKYISQNKDFDKIALLVSFHSNDFNSYKEYIEIISIQISTRLWDNYGIKVSAAAGNLCNDLISLSGSYNEALHLLESSVAAIPNKVLWFEKPSENNCKFYYPLDIELRIMNLAKIGDEVEIKVLLESIYKENFQERQLSCEMMKQLIYEIKGTITKLMDEIHVSADELSEEYSFSVDSLCHSCSIDDAYSEIKKIFNRLCSIINNRKKSHNIKLKGDLLEYINGNYMDPNFCLYMVSSKFDLTEAYTSQFLKEQLGETFSIYLERIRIEKANELLYNSELCIDEIAQLVGYNSAHSFRRAFKRVTGILPTACRDKEKVKI